MKKNFIVGGAIIFLLVILGVYFFISGNRADALMLKKDKIQKAITAAEAKLNKEKETLEALKGGLRDSFPLGASMQDQMKELSDYVRSTDFMFVNPYGSDPRLILGNSSNSALLNSERQEINLLLLEWQSQMDLLSIAEIDINQSMEIRRNMERIKKFLEDLRRLVRSLPQPQIDNYEPLLPTEDEVDEVLDSVDDAIENPNSPINPGANPPSTTPNPGTGTTNPPTNTNNPGTGNNPNVPNTLPTTPNSPNPPVTPGDVIDQEEEVKKAQDEVDDLEDELDDVEDEIDKLNNPNPPVSDPDPNPTTSDTDTNTNPANPNPDNGNNDGSDDDDTSDDPDNPGGIIIQEGEPRLIQGSDPF